MINKKLPSLQFLEELNKQPPNTEEMIKKENVTPPPVLKVKRDKQTLTQIKNKNYYDKNKEKIISQKSATLKKKSAMKKSLIKELEMLINEKPEIQLMPGNYNLKLHNNRYNINLQITLNNGKK